MDAKKYFDEKGNAIEVDPLKIPYEFGTFPQLFDEYRNMVLMGDIEKFPIGVVVTKVRLISEYVTMQQGPDGDLSDWHPLDHLSAKEWAEETSYCSDVESVEFEHNGKSKIFRAKAT